MGYKRVIPRDLFNESKLLKCIGQLVLHIQDGKVPKGLGVAEEMFAVSQCESGFEIEQADHDGSLRISNLNFFLGGQRLEFRSLYNSRESYPLVLVLEDYEEIEVFHDDGTFTDFFITWCEDNL